MVIKVHGHLLSAPVKRVVACLEEKALPYESVLIDIMTGQQKEETFLALNPFGQVPAIEDGDLELFQSRAITQYIANVYADKGTPLVPNDPKKMAIVSVWTAVKSGRFDVVASKLSYEIFIKPILGMTTDEGVVEQNQEMLGKILDVYESRLSQSKYLGGDEFSLADLHHLPIVNNLFGTKVKAMFDARPSVKAWCDDILCRPAWQKVLQCMKF